MSVVPIDALQAGARPNMDEEEELAMSRMNLSTTSQQLNEKGGYKINEATNESSLQGAASSFRSSGSRRKSKIKYSGYGEEYAIQKIKMGETATSNRKYKNLRRKRGDPGCFIDPHNPFMKKWDPYMTFLLLYTALITPYEVGFLASPSNWEERANDGLWIFNQIVNLSFLVGKSHKLYFARISISHTAHKC